MPDRLTAPSTLTVTIRVRFGIAYIALISSFALTALASPAMAADHHFNGTEGDPLEATANEDQVFTPTTGGTQGFICHEVAVTGEVEAETAGSLTVEPEYVGGSCFTEENGEETTTKAFIEASGCHYTLQGATTEGNPTGGEHANLSIVCPAEESISIRVTTFNLGCVSIPPQTISDSVRYEDLGNGDVKVIPTAHGIESTTEGVCEGKEGSIEVSVGHVTVTRPGSGGHSPPSFSMAREINA